MKTNKLILAAAGSGKTTYLVKEALKCEEKVLITTFTIANSEEIKNRFIEINNYVPAHVTIQTWFSFLINEGAKPYQGTFNEKLYGYSIKNLLFCETGKEGKYPVSKNGKTQYTPKNEENYFLEHYFTKTQKIYSDRLSKFVIKSNNKSEGKVMKRISNCFKFIFIDEVQDLAGYDLEIIKELFKSTSSIVLVGDPRQVTYKTHNERKHKGYNEGRIKEFIQDKCKNKKLNIEIDEDTLNCSFRNNYIICKFASKLYSGIFKESIPCTSGNCRNSPENGHEGVFLVREEHIGNYLNSFNPVQLRWDSKKKVFDGFDVYNFGGSKGKTFDRVLIYPTKDMLEWISNNSTILKPTVKAKFYVAITRARYSVGIVCNFSQMNILDDLQYYSPSPHVQPNPPLPKP